MLIILCRKEIYDFCVLKIVDINHHFNMSIWHIKSIQFKYKKKCLIFWKDTFTTLKNDTILLTLILQYYDFKKQGWYHEH